MRLTPRYAISMLVQTAEVDGSSNNQAPILPFGKSAGTSIKQEAITYLNFDYIAGGINKNGVRITEVKDEKSTDLIQIVAEGNSKIQIQNFLKQLIVDLKKRYRDKIEDVLEHGNERISFLKREIASLQNFKAEVENAVENVGPSPSLVVQLMDLKNNIVRLQQDLLLAEAGLSNERVHNFKLKSIRLVNGGLPVWPKRIPMALMGALMGFLLSAGIILSMHIFKQKSSKNVSSDLSEEALNELEAIADFENEIRSELTAHHNADNAKTTATGLVQKNSTANENEQKNNITNKVPGNIDYKYNSGGSLDFQEQLESELDSLLNNLIRIESTKDESGKMKITRIS